MENQLTIAFIYAVLYTLLFSSFKFLMECFSRLTSGYKRKKQHISAIWEHVMEKTNQLYDLSFQKGVCFDDRLQVRNLREAIGILSQMGPSIQKREIDDLYHVTECIYLNWINTSHDKINDEEEKNEKSIKIENCILHIQRGILQIRSYL